MRHIHRSRNANGNVNYVFLWEASTLICRRILRLFHVLFFTCYEVFTNLVSGTLNFILFYFLYI